MVEKRGILIVFMIAGLLSFDENIFFAANEQTQGKKLDESKDNLISSYFHNKKPLSKKSVIAKSDDQISEMDPEIRLHQERFDDHEDM